MNSLLFLLNFLIFIGAQAQLDTHAGHNHKAEEKCTVAGLANTEASELGQHVQAAAKKLELSQEFCTAVKACGNQLHELYCSDQTANHVKSRINKCGLTHQDTVALSFYMGIGFGCVNPVLFGRENKPVQPIVDSINTALSKFPSYEGFVARGAWLPENFAKQHKVGAVVTYKSFTSTSTSPATAIQFSTEGDGSTILLIYSKTGKPIMGLNEGENEVLFKSNTKFKVLKSEVGNNFAGTKTRYILMREVSPGEKAKQMDKFVLDQAKLLPDKAFSGEFDDGIYQSDMWSCPTTGKMPAAVVKQKALPDFGRFSQHFKN